MAWESNRESERGPGVKEDTSQKTCLGEAEEHKIWTEEDYKLKVGAYVLSVSLPYLRTKGICLCCPKKPSHTEMKLFFWWVERGFRMLSYLLSTTIGINQVAISMRRVSIWQEIRCCPFPSITLCIMFFFFFFFFSKALSLLIMWLNFLSFSLVMNDFTESFSLIWSKNGYLVLLGDVWMWRSGKFTLWNLH